MATIGAATLTHLAEKIERTSGDLAGLQEVVGQMEQEFRKVRVAVQNLNAAVQAGRAVRP